MRKNQKKLNKNTPEDIVVGFMKEAFGRLCSKTGVDGKLLTFDSITNRHVNEWLRETLKELIIYAYDKKLVTKLEEKKFLDELEKDLNDDKVIMSDIRKKLKENEYLFRGFFDGKFYKLYETVWRISYFSLNNSIRSTEEDLKFTKEVVNTIRDDYQKLQKKSRTKIDGLEKKIKERNIIINILIDQKDKEINVLKKELKAKEALIKKLKLSNNYNTSDSDNNDNISNKESVLDRMNQPFEEDVKLNNSNTDNGSTNVIQLNTDSTIKNSNNSQKKTPTTKINKQGFFHSQNKNNNNNNKNNTTINVDQNIISNQNK